MRYVMLICTDESADAALSPAEGEAMFGEYMKFGEEMTKRGVLDGGERLRPTTDATTVQVRDGEVLTSDGPFAETKEQIGGFYLVDCQGPRRGHRDRGEDPRRARRLDRGEADLGDVSGDRRVPMSRPRSPAAFRSEWGRVVATLIRVTGDWDLAEECAQDAFARALERWPRDGIPRNPGAWLTTTARNRAARSPAPRRDRGRQAAGGRRDVAARRSPATAATTTTRSTTAASRTTACG